MRDVRAVINEDGPADDYEARRLALRAVSRISDRDRCQELYDRLYVAILSIGLGPAMGEATAEEARQLARVVLDEIEAASRPN